MEPLCRLNPVPVFIAHLPAGYLVTRVLWPRLRFERSLVATLGRSPAREWRLALTVGLTASLAPDLDLLWFYGVDGGQTHHHHFFPHLPFVWIVGGVVALGICAVLRKRRAAQLVILATCCGLMHLLLDTVVGHIKWGWPLSPHMFAAFDVPVRGGHWVLNFVLHWSFALEVLIVAVAVGVAFVERRNRGRRRRGETLPLESHDGPKVTVSSPHDD